MLTALYLYFRYPLVIYNSLLLKMAIESLIYPLYNLIAWWFSIAFCMFTRGYIPVTGVSTHGGTPKSSISRLIFHEINHPALGYPHDHGNLHMGVGQNLLLSILMGWTSIYQLFWGSLGAMVLTNSHIKLSRHRCAELTWSSRLSATTPPEIYGCQLGSQGSQRWHRWQSPFGVTGSPIMRT